MCIKFLNSKMFAKPHLHPYKNAAVSPADGYLTVWQGFWDDVLCCPLICIVWYIELFPLLPCIMHLFSICPYYSKHFNNFKYYNYVSENETNSYFTHHWSYWLKLPFIYSLWIDEWTCHTVLLEHSYLQRYNVPNL